MTRTQTQPASSQGGLRNDNGSGEGTLSRLGSHIADRGAPAVDQGTGPSEAPRRRESREVRHETSGGAPLGVQGNTSSRSVSTVHVREVHRCR
jgi:hypothetical protein